MCRWKQEHLGLREPWRASAPRFLSKHLTVGRFCTRAKRLHLARLKHAPIKLVFAKRQREVLDTRAMRVRSPIRVPPRPLSFFPPRDPASCYPDESSTRAVLHPSVSLCIYSGYGRFDPSDLDHAFNLSDELGLERRLGLACVLDLSEQQDLEQLAARPCL